MQLAKAVYELTASFPVEERYGFAQQMRRAAVSISGSIAEGQAEMVQKIFAFIGIPRGSLAELETQMQLAVMPGFTTADHAAFDLADRTGKLLTGFHEKLSTT